MLIHLQKLAFRNLFRNRFRSLLLLTTIAISSAVIILIGGFYDYLFKSLEKELISTIGHIQVLPEKDKSGSASRILNYRKIEDLLSGDKRILLVTPTIYLNGIIGYKDRSALFSGEAVNYADRRMMMQVAYGKKGAASGPDGGYLGTVLARQLKVKKGDIVNAVSSTGGMISGFSFTVNGIVTTASEDQDRVYVKIPIRLLINKIGIRAVDNFDILVKDRSKIGSVVRSLKSLFKEKGWALHVKAFNEAGSYFQSVINIYMNNYYFVLAVILVTIFFSIANALTMSIMERVREVGTMRSFGVNKYNVTALFVSEGFYLGLTGFVIGLAISVLTALIVNAFGGIYLPPPPTIEKGFYSRINIALIPVLIALASAVSVSILSSFISTIKINRMSVTGELTHI